MRQSEVHQFHIARAIDHEVLRLKVTMHDPLCMCLTKPLTDLSGYLNSGSRAQRAEAVENASKTFSLDEFHGDERDSITSIEIVDAANVLVRDFPRHT